MDGPQLGDLVLDGKYELLEQVKACVGSKPHYVGTPGACRFCDRSGNRFRKKAHAFPEALGNKWVISRDECDCCNDCFSAYESALVAAVSPFLALGGTKGKGSGNRQVGRSAGDRTLVHSVVEGKRNLTLVCKDLGLDGVEPQLTPSGSIRMKLPIAATAFRPRFAYKALAKMGLALLPNDELGNFQRLRAWLLDTEEQTLFRRLNVALSFASIGNSPGLITGTLLRRVHRWDLNPHILFIFCAGSICFQIDLMSDHLDGHLSMLPYVRSDINWQTVVNGDKGRSLRFDYGTPVHRDWSSHDSEPQPLEFLWFEFNPKSCEGRLIPVFR